MFQTGHHTGAFHGAARAVSGGPIYISDEVGKENIETIHAMASSRGELFRSSNHGQVCRDNLFTDIKKEKKAIKIFTDNVCNSIVGTFNCSFNDENPIIVTSDVKAADVEGIEGNSFAVYNFKTGKLAVANATEAFEEKLDPLDFNLYTISPIEEGFAPIGLSGKYNPGATITNFIRTGKKEWVLELMDGGDLICYANKKPKEVTLNGELVDFSYKKKSLKIRLPLLEGMVVKVEF
jgi:raffinose synthase